MYAGVRSDKQANSQSVRHTVRDAYIQTNIYLAGFSKEVTASDKRGVVIKKTPPPLIDFS